MTVKQLIQYLSQFDPDTNIFVYDDGFITEPNFVPSESGPFKGDLVMEVVKLVEDEK